MSTAELPVEEKPRDIIDVIRWCQRNRIPGDIVGRWVWVRFATKPDAETRNRLKAAGFRWVKSRGEWAHNCGYHSRHGNCNPRRKYGVMPVSEVNVNE